jgi:microcin C transport system permease protein
MSYRGSLFVPVVREIHPSELGIEDAVVVNYRSLKFDHGDWALWPLNPWDPFESNTHVDRFPSPPSGENWLGTDDRGRDIFSRLLYGFRYSITFAVVVWLLTVTGAILIGGTMGYFGGMADLIGQRVVEILSTIPVFFLLIILVATFEPSLGLLVVITSLFSWIGLSYYVRGEFLKNRKMDFVESARSLGATHPRLIFKHVLPNSLVPVITFSPFILSSDVLRLASLDYLGFGLRPPTPSWGELLNQAQKNFTTAWWLSVYPGLALFLALVILAMIGEGVRTAMDPRKG